MDRPRDLKEDGTLHNAFLEAAHILPFHYMAPPKSTSNISSIMSIPSSSRSSSRRSSLRAPIVGYSPLSSPLERRSSVQSASTGRSSNRSMPDIQNPSLTTATQTSKVNPIIKAKVSLFISSHANYVKWNSWHALLTFAGDHYAQNLVAGTHMNAPHNGLLLQRDVHHLFDSLRGWLEPVVSNNLKLLVLIKFRITIHFPIRMITIGDSPKRREAFPG
jgi:HNH endonuclease